MKMGTKYPNKWTHGLSYQIDLMMIFYNEPLVSVLNFSKYHLNCSFAPVEIAILLRKPFIDLSLHEPSFRVFSSCFSLLGMPFFSFLYIYIYFYCFAMRLRTWTLFKMNEFFFIFLRKKLFSSSTCIWSKWTFKVRNVGQVRVSMRRG